MTPLSPEAVAQMMADREAGTPGPWQFQTETDEGVNVTADIVTVHWSNLGFGTDENDTRVDDIIKANARLPDLEAAYLTLAAENATLRAERAMLKFDNATMLTQIEGHNAAWDALRASEAAALERRAGDGGLGCRVPDGDGCYLSGTAMVGLKAEGVE